MAAQSKFFCDWIRNGTVVTEEGVLKVLLNLETGVVFSYEVQGTDGFMDCVDASQQIIRDYVKALKSLGTKE